MNLIEGYAALMINRQLLMNITIKDQKFIQRKPTDMIKKIQLGDWYYPGNRVLQSDSSYSNLHVYSKTLTIEEMTLNAGEQACNQKGDYLAREDMQWEMHGNATIVLGEEDICEKEGNSMNQFLFKERFQWQTCMEFCAKIHNGRMPAVTNRNELNELMTWMKYVDPLATTIWAPYTDAEIEGVWRDFYLKQKQPMSNKGLFQEGQPNGERFQNCMAVQQTGLVDDACDNEALSNSCVCRYHKPPILALRGLCTKSYLDSHYTLYGKPR